MNFRKNPIKIVASCLVLAIAGIISPLGNSAAEATVPYTGTRVSLDSNGNEGNNWSYPSSVGTSMSKDGRYIAFASAASNLAPNDTNGLNDVFVKDRSTGAIERVSVSNSGGQSNRDSAD
jgi:hypothetical protein